MAKLPVVRIGFTSISSFAGLGGSQLPHSIDLINLWAISLLGNIPAFMKNFYSILNISVPALKGEVLFFHIRNRELYIYLKFKVYDYLTFLTKIYKELNCILKYL